MLKPGDLGECEEKSSSRRSCRGVFQGIIACHHWPASPNPHDVVHMLAQPRRVAPPRLSPPPPPPRFTESSSTIPTRYHDLRHSTPPAPRPQSPSSRNCPLHSLITITNKKPKISGPLVHKQPHYDSRLLHPVFFTPRLVPETSGGTNTTGTGAGWNPAAAGYKLRPESGRL